jgi:archaellum component FlaF (FlaF/FlaG flagellin family)
MKFVQYRLIWSKPVICAEWGEGDVRKLSFTDMSFKEIKFLHNSYDDIKNKFVCAKHTFVLPSHRSTLQRCRWNCVNYWSYTYLDVTHTYLDVTHTYLDVTHTYLDVTHTYLGLTHTYLDVTHTHLGLTHTYLDVTHTYLDVTHTYLGLTHTYLGLTHTHLGLTHC